MFMGVCSWVYVHECIFICVLIMALSSGLKLKFRLTSFLIIFEILFLYSIFLAHLHIKLIELIKDRILYHKLCFVSTKLGKTE